MLKGEGNLCAQ